MKLNIYDVYSESMVHMMLTGQLQVIHLILTTPSLNGEGPRLAITNY